MAEADAGLTVFVAVIRAATAAHPTERAGHWAARVLQIAEEQASRMSQEEAPRSPQRARTAPTANATGRA